MTGCFKSLLLWASITVAAISPVAWSQQQSQASHPFEAEFKRWGGRFTPEFSYLWLVAQAQQESNYDPMAISHAGARGVMQILPRTQVEIQTKLGVTCAWHSPRCSIMMGAFYDRYLFRQWWRRGRTTAEKIPLMQAGYNAGLGRVLSGQAACEDGRRFVDIAPCLPAETRDYVKRIHRNYYRYKRD